MPQPDITPELPVLAALPDLMRALARSGCAVLQAPPGAGKTTRVPLALLNEPWLAKRKILLLEPRRLAARLAADFMARQLGESTGQTVGYRIRNDSRVGAGTRIEVLTEGILTRRIQRDPELADTALVIFDEFHERSLAADLGLALALDVQQGLRGDLRILVMSATLDEQALTRLLDAAPLIRSEGRMYPVATHYAPGPRGLAPAQAAARQAAAALADTAGDILVFLPGVAEIRAAQQTLTARGVDALVSPLYGELPFDAQRAALRPATDGMRKIVLATAIAETSLTIEGVRTVVDAGLMRVPRFDPARGMTRLVTLPVSAAAADQRRGRAGRLGPGVCWRLWSEARHRTLAAHSPAEIETADLAGFALELALWGVSDPGRIRLLTAPPAAAYAQATDLLRSLEAVDEAGAITRHGRELASLGTHPRLAQLLLRAAADGSLALGARLAALLEERDVLLEGHAEADLELRLQALEGAGRDPRAKRAVVRRVVQQARRWCRQFKVADAVGHYGADDIGKLVAAAYPERVAQRRAPGGNRYLLAQGTGTRLHEHDGLRKHAYLAVAEVHGGGADARISLAAAISDAQLRTQFAAALRTRRAVRFDAKAGGVVATETLALGALSLEARPWRDPPAEALTQAMLEGVAELGLAALPWSRELTEWRSRVSFLRHTDPELGLADVGDAALLAELADWLGPYLNGITRSKQLKNIDLRAALAARIGWDKRATLDELAPTHWPTPAGRRVRLDYAVNPAHGETPVMAVRLQDMFGCDVTPRIVGGRVPLTMHLLSPARRPLQITQDLASFWRNGYAEVRKQMRGRYPKHPWPENPTAHSE